MSRNSYYYYNGDKISVVGVAFLYSFLLLTISMSLSSSASDESIPNGVVDLVLFNSTSASASELGASGNYVLSLGWLGSLCSKCSRSRCCISSTTKPVQDFVVWSLKLYKNPYCFKPCRNPGYCNYNNQAIDDLLPSMNYYWPKLGCSYGDSWRRTWCSYGSRCSQFNQHDYFQKGIMLASQVKPLWFLQQKGIVPSSTERYSLTKIQNALAQFLGNNTFFIECVWRNGASAVAYVHVCYNADATSRVGCPKNWKTVSNCKPNVLLPPAYTSVSSAAAAENGNNGPNNAVTDFIKMATDRS